MKDKYYVRAEGLTAGIFHNGVTSEGKILKGSEGVKHEAVILGAGTNQEFLDRLLALLTLNRRPVPITVWKGNKYKRKAIVKGVSPENWRVYKKNLEVRGFELTPTRSFRRLAR